MTRVRTDSTPTVNGAHKNYRNGSYYGTTSYVDTDRYSSTCSDVVTPNFRQRVKSGAVINNPCSIVVDHQQVNGSGYASSLRLSNNWLYEVYGDGSVTQWYLQVCAGNLDYGDTSPDGVSELISQLKHSALDRVDKTPYSFAEDIGELRETINFLRNSLGSLAKLSSRYKRAVKHARLLNGRVIRSLAEASANVWLEYRFAAMPLLRTTLNLYEALPEEVHRPRRQTARAFGKIDTSMSLQPQTIQYYSNNTCTFNVSTIVEREVRVGCLYEVSNPLEDIYYKYGIRYKDIPETAWNLLPLSFMVDRVADISGTIRGLTNLLDPSIKSLAGFVVTKSNTVKSTALTGIDAVGYTSSVSPDLIFDKDFSYSRDIWVPGYADVVPSLNLGGLTSSVTRTTDLLTLILTNFSSRGKAIQYRRF